MTSTINSTLASAGCLHGGAVRWGSPVPERRGGIYLIALVGDPDSASETIKEAPIDRQRVELWLQESPDVKVDGRPATIAGLYGRLTSMWLPDETIVYIGKATSLASRASQYYATKLGAKSPHSGGWPLKALRNLDDLWVHWSVVPMPELEEQKALAGFVSRVSERTRNDLHDPAHPYPYANLEGPGGRRRHGISGARGQPLRTAIVRGTAPDQRAPATIPTPYSASSMSGSGARTQQVTETDRKAGRIRIPRTSKSTFPDERCQINVVLRGEAMSARWDPRYGPPERSGTIGVGKEQLNRLVRTGEVLRVTVSESTWTID